MLVGACCLALAAVAGSAAAAGPNGANPAGNANTNTGVPGASTWNAANMGHRGATAAKPARDEMRDAQSQVDKAAHVVQSMQKDPKAASLLQQARGAFVITSFGRAALGIGGRGGAGVLMVNRNGTWSDPAFYNTGGVSIGAEAGAEGGSMVFVLNTEKAVDAFRHSNNWSLNAEAGLTIVNWSGKAQGSVGKSDVTIWSNTKGLLGSLAISVTDIRYDQGETSAFYGKPMRVADVFSGNAEPKGNVAQLRDALAAAGTAAAKAASAIGGANPTAKSSMSARQSSDNAHRND
jgi:lipid-binding SYLF domain-containing protein